MADDAMDQIFGAELGEAGLEVPIPELDAHADLPPDPAAPGATPPEPPVPGATPPEPPVPGATPPEPPPPPWSPDTIPQEQRGAYDVGALLVDRASDPVVNELLHSIISGRASPEALRAVLDHSAPPAPQAPPPEPGAFDLDTADTAAFGRHLDERDARLLAQVQDAVRESVGPIQDQLEQQRLQATRQQAADFESKHGDWTTYKAEMMPLVQSGVPLEQAYTYAKALHAQNAAGPAPPKANPNLPAPTAAPGATPARPKGLAALARFVVESEGLREE